MPFVISQSCNGMGFGGIFYDGQRQWHIFFVCLLVSFSFINIPSSQVRLQDIRFGNTSLSEQSITSTRNTRCSSA